MSSYGLTKAQETALVVLLDDKEVIRDGNGKWSGASKAEITINTILGLFDRRLIRVRCTAAKNARAPYLSAVLTALGARVALVIRSERDAATKQDAA